MREENKPSEAQESLIQIIEAFRRMRIALARRKTGNYLILWGFILFVGYILTEIFMRLGKYDSIVWVWIILPTIGLIGVCLITVNQTKKTKERFPEGFYIFLIWISLVFYGFIIFAVILWMGNVSLNGIQVSLLFLNLAMFGYVLMGILLGKELALIGISTSILSVLCGLFLQKFFNLAMALICLITFVGGGFYINKKWELKNESTS